MITLKLTSNKVMKRALILMGVLFMLCGTVYAGSSLTDWGQWTNIDGKSQYRIHISYFNSSAQKYVYEMEVKNNTDQVLGISVAITDYANPTEPNYSRNSNINAHKSYVFPLMFCSAAPGQGVKVWWENIVYK